MKKTAALLLSFLLLLWCAVPAGAAHVTYGEAASALETLGLLRGTGSGDEPERAPTRAEALVMLLRLLGEESRAEAGGVSSPFTDISGSWAESFIAYARSRGLVRGVTDTSFSPGGTVSVRDYLTMVLRALGYAEGTDFTWAESIAFSDSVGLTHGEYSSSSQFLREDMALVSYTALTLTPKGSDSALAAELYRSGAVSYSALVSTRLSGCVNTKKTVLSAPEIYERCSSAAFLLTFYKSDADYAAGTAFSTASGFFITPDGVAVTCYHAIDNARRGVVQTADGRSFEISGVLGYDAMRDFAVVRVSRTDTSGRAVTRFPYLDTGDSDAIAAGDTAYTVSSPLGLSGSISSGIISAKSRVADDPAYPCIQSTAAISSGSSGGALLDAYGEVIGIAYAAFTQGNSLELFVPINAISSVPLTGEGEALSALCSRMDALKAGSKLWADPPSVSVSAGGTVSVTIHTDYPTVVNFRFSIAGANVLASSEPISCAWSGMLTKTSAVLKVTGLEAGTTVLTVNLYNTSNDDLSVSIPVTVTAAASD